MSGVDLWEAPDAALCAIIERLDRIERMLGAGQVRTVTQVQMRYRGMVLQAIEDGHHTIREIREHLAISKQRVSDALRMLEAEGAVLRSQRVAAGRGRPGDYFTCAVNSADEPRTKFSEPS